MDFTISPEIESYRQRIARMVEDDILPLEADPASYDEHENIRLDLLDRMRAKARDAGLWCLQLKPESGGVGLGRMGMAVCYEEMNRSIFGPVIFNSAAPDDGNMMVLEALGTSQQKERWLAPIVQGKVRSAFAMTEPHPGGGSDPSMIGTKAEKRGDKWVISGRKMVHHRRRGSRPLHPDGAHVGRPASRPDGLPVPQGPARLENPEAHPDHGPGRAWRPLRTGVRRT